MKETNKRHILARYTFVVGIMLAFSILIVWDLFKTSVVQAQAWNAKADSVLTDTTLIQPERGKLLADNGSVLSANLQFYIPRIDWLSPSVKEKTLLKHIDALSDSLAVFDPSRSSSEWKERLLNEREEILEAYKNTGKKRQTRLFRRQITHNEYKRIRAFPFFNLGAESGMHADMVTRRYKPYGSLAARSIGNVNQPDGNEGIHGHSGLEMALDSMLYGQPGIAKRIQLTSGIVNAESKPAVKGYDITTTINVNIQDIVENELDKMCKETNARWGTAVLMETATGEIKAISNLEWNEKEGRYLEGRNNAVLGYEPGSVMKPISMMVALEDGIVDNIEQPWATGHVWNYLDRPITDPHGSGSLTPRQIIETSSNIGMSKIIVKDYGQNPGGFYDKLKSMGFFEPFNMGIAGETQPVIRRLNNNSQDRVALTRMAFGYSTLIPPTSILAIYNAIANDGRYVRPRLVKKLSREGMPDSIVPVDYIRKQVCSPENARKLRIMLHDVVWGNRGTARKWVQDDDVEIAGKTGTAYTITNDGHYGDTKRLAFCGFFPYENPKYTCVVVMMGANRGAGASSGMVLKNIARKLYARGYLGTMPNYAGKEKNQAKPTLYASTNSHAVENVRKGIGASQGVKILPSPRKQAKGVPDVTGLGVREAITCLESVGLSVRFSGAGRVVSQDISPGSAFTRGQLIQLQCRL